MRKQMCLRDDCFAQKRRNNTCNILIWDEKQGIKPYDNEFKCPFFKTHKQFVDGMRKHPVPERYRVEEKEKKK